MLENKQTKIGIDTSFLIDFLKGNKAAVLLMQKYQNNVVISNLVIYEFLCGNLSIEQLKKFYQFISNFWLLDNDLATCITASSIYKKCRENGNIVCYEKKHKQ